MGLLIVQPPLDACYTKEKTKTSNPQQKKDGGVNRVYICEGEERAWGGETQLESTKTKNKR